jgi:hypothetical protein
VWIADASSAGTSANLWLLLVTIVSSATTLATAWIARRRGKSPASRGAADDAVKQYRRYFAEPLHRDNELLRAEIKVARAETEAYRKRWRDCEDAADE